MVSSDSYSETEDTTTSKKTTSQPSLQIMLLYWFDYLGGYDTIFAQLGWNTSVINQQIAQLRGAATMQNKDWGTIITWKYHAATIP